MTTVAIHQPNYLPWLGFFYKLYAADIFVLLDDVAFSKGSPTARTRYRKQPGTTQMGYLTVPLQKFSLGTPIRDLRIDHRQDWARRHWQQLSNSYRRAPHFEVYGPLLCQWLEQAPEYDFLAAWNEYLIGEMCRILDLNTQLLRSGDQPVAGERTSYLINLIHYVNGDTYLSGQGAKKYQEVAAFQAAGIQLQYNTFFTYLENSPYSQGREPWLNGLSILDALFYIGAEGILDLFRHYHPEAD